MKYLVLLFLLSSNISAQTTDTTHQKKMLCNIECFYVEVGDRSVSVRIEEGRSDVEMDAEYTEYSIDLYEIGWGNDIEGLHFFEHQGSIWEISLLISAYKLTSYRQILYATTGFAVTRLIITRPIQDDDGMEAMKSEALKRYLEKLLNE